MNLPGCSNERVCVPDEHSARGNHVMINNVLSGARALLLMSCLSPALAGAQDKYAPTDAELRLLPAYCTAKLRDVSELEEKKWRQTLGKDFVHVHHYCFALNFISRASMQSDVGKKSFSYHQALNNLEYMEEHASADFVLMPEIYVKFGNVLRLVNRDSEAATKFLKAIELHPSYTPAYGSLSDYYLDLGNVEKARETLEEGLARSPSSKLLKRKLAALKGKTGGRS